MKLPPPPKPPKIIYVTAFDNDTKKIHDQSVDSHMKSLDEVLRIVSSPIILKTKRMIVYTGVVFSDFPFYSGNVQSL